jgi:GNAT superfamily N-acetyltransferase
MTAYWLRPARPADLQAVRELSRRVRREHRLSVRGGDALTSAGTGNLLWVVEAGRGEIVGSCGARDIGSGKWELHTLFLALEWRGIGLGRALVEQAICAVDQEGALELACTVPAELSEAAALLRRLGFVSTSGGGAAGQRLTKPLRGLS